MGIRLQRIIAGRGYTSRRKAERLILEGRVRVDGTVVDQPGTQFPWNAEIEIDGKRVGKVPPVYIMLNKPIGYLCSKHDPEGRPLVYDLLDTVHRDAGVFSVGRLDYLSEGLLLFTNNGVFANAVIHPSSGILKQYLVSTYRDIPYKTIAEWKSGVYIKGVRYAIHRFKRISSKKVLLVLAEGKNREIRRLFESINLEVKRLTRVGLGPLKLGKLAPGTYRSLTREEKDAVIRESRKHIPPIKESLDNRNRTTGRISR